MREGIRRVRDMLKLAKGSSMERDVGVEGMVELKSQEETEEVPTIESFRPLEEMKA